MTMVKFCMPVSYMVYLPAEPCGYTHRTIPCSTANTGLNFIHVSTNVACYLLVLRATDRFTSINFRPLLEDLSWTKNIIPSPRRGICLNPALPQPLTLSKARSHSLFSLTCDLTRFFNPRMFNHQISKFVQISVWPFSRPHCSFPPAGSSLSPLGGSTWILEAPMAAH